LNPRTARTGEKFGLEWPRINREFSLTAMPYFPRKKGLFAQGKGSAVSGLPLYPGTKDQKSYKLKVSKVI